MLNIDLIFKQHHITKTIKLKMLQRHLVLIYSVNLRKRDKYQTNYGECIFNIKNTNII